MTREHSMAIKVGDTVIHNGEAVIILSIERGGIGGPLFRMTGVTEGLTSYMLVQAP